MSVSTLANSLWNRMTSMIDLEIVLDTVSRANNSLESLSQSKV